MERASLRRLLPAALRWIGSYERRALEILGREYRHHCLESFPHTAALPERVLAEWERLAVRFEAVLAVE